MNTYKNKWKHPKWQKKRLEILKRDKFSCQHCHDKDSTLAVHHLFYDYKEYVNPWDYKNKHLMTLCERCHEWEHKLWKKYAKDLYGASINHEKKLGEKCFYDCAEIYGLTVRISLAMGVDDSYFEGVFNVITDIYDQLNTSNLINNVGGFLMPFHPDTYAKTLRIKFNIRVKDDNKLAEQEELLNL